MPRKGPKHRMWIAPGVHRPGEVRVQALDGHADGPDALLVAVPAAPQILAQEVGYRFQLALRLGLHRLDCLPEAIPFTRYRASNFEAAASRFEAGRIAVIRDGLFLNLEPALCQLTPFGGKIGFPIWVAGATRTA